jgi:hypothetical protein
MKAFNMAILAGVASLQLTACSTYIDAYGNQRTGLTPEGAAVLETALATAIGTGAGALMENQPGWASGMVSGSTASAISQLVTAAIPQVPADATTYQPPYNTGYQMQAMQGYQQLYTQGQNGQLIQLSPSERQFAAQLNLPIFARTPNGQFVRLY